VSVETPDYAAMLRRMVRAYGRRVAQESPEDLAEMLSVVDELERALRAAVAGQREAGFSWAEIGRGLGVTKQTAFARFSPNLSHAVSGVATVTPHDDAC
jgi:hypothetical protein